MVSQMRRMIGLPVEEWLVVEMNQDEKNIMIAKLTGRIVKFKNGKMNGIVNKDIGEVIEGG